MMLTLFGIIHFATLGQAFDSQCNNKDGKKCAKEVLQSNQAHFYTNPLNSETHDRPAHFKQLPVPTNNPAIITPCFLRLYHPFNTATTATISQVPTTMTATMAAAMTQVPTTTTATTMTATMTHVSAIRNATSIWHQVFDNTLSQLLIMNVSNITSVPTLNALLTSSYLHPAKTATKNAIMKRLLLP